MVGRLKSIRFNTRADDRVEVTGMVKTQAGATAPIFLGTAVDAAGLEKLVERANERFPQPGGKGLADEHGD